MKRKVLVLTMGIICATQLWHSNHVNALVTESGANDTKQFTEIVSEEKVITVEHAHVKEAQSLVENYKDTQSADARMKAKQKVNTLSKPHQNYFNKQIDKVYNGLQR